MSKDEKNKQNKNEADSSVVHTPRSSKNMHSEHDNSTKDGLKIDKDKKKKKSK